MNTEAENAGLAGMAGEAAAIDSKYDKYEYWMGGLRTEQGWKWRSGQPMEYTNWQEDNPDGLKGGNFTSLLKNDFPVFRWAAEAEATGGDNGVICEMRSV